MAPPTRGRMMREARRAAQFAKFRRVELNLVPLVDTFVAIVFFALTTQTLGAIAPVMTGVNLPESRLEQPAQEQLTLGVGAQEVRFGRGEDAIAVMSTVQAAQAVSTNPQQPLLIPGLYAVLRQHADSIRAERDTPSDESVDVPLAIQAEKTMRYDLLSRVLQTARLAGFSNLTLQVLRTRGEDAPAPAT